MSIPIGLTNQDIRRDFIDLEYVPVEILGADGLGNGEFHQCLAFTGMNNKFGISPNEMPQRRDDLPDSGIIVYEVDASNNLTGFSALGDPLEQVVPSVSSEPGIGQYAVDINNAAQYLNTGRFIFNSANVNKYYRIHRYYGLGTLATVRNIQAVAEAAVGSGGETSILTKLKTNGLNTPDRTWTGVTVNLNAGVSQVGNLTISGAVLVRATNTASDAILEVYGNLTFEAGASLESYKVFLIVHGDVMGDASTPGIIKAPNGANGGAVSVNGSNAIAELGGTGGTGSTSGGGGGGGFGNGGSANAIIGGVGAGGGGGEGGFLGGPGGVGGTISEAEYCGAGGNGAGGLVASPFTYGAGGGGGGLWLKFIAFGNITNIIFKSGKGGVGGGGNTNGFGGQSGSIRAFFNRDLLTNVTFDVTAGTSTSTVRDGTAGNLRLNDLSEGQNSYGDTVTTVKDETTLVWAYSNAEDYLTRLVGYLTLLGYFTKPSTGV